MLGVLSNNAHDSALRGELPMTDIILLQADADKLLAIEKHRVNDRVLWFPRLGQSEAIDLLSADETEKFLLDLSCGHDSLLKIKLQIRARRSVVLARLDLSGSRHRNPDDKSIGTPHLHVYKQGFGDQWAIPVPPDSFSDISSLSTTFGDFMRYCNITKPPCIHFQGGLSR